MKKLSTKEWVAVVVALVIVAVFMLFPGILKSVTGVNPQAPQLNSPVQTF